MTIVIRSVIADPSGLPSLTRRSRSAGVQITLLGSLLRGGPLLGLEELDVLGQLGLGRVGQEAQQRVEKSRHDDITAIRKNAG